MPIALYISQTSKDQAKRFFFLLQLSQQTLALEQKHNLVDRCPDIADGQIDSQVRVGRDLVRVVDTGEALDLTSTCLGVDTALVVLLCPLERGSDVDEVEGAIPLNRLAGSLS